MKLEELDAIEAEIQKAIDDKEIAIMVIPSRVMQLIAAARRAIPRPISEAPRDGTEIDVFWKDGSRSTNCRFLGGELVDNENDPLIFYLGIGAASRDWADGATWLPTPLPE